MFATCHFPFAACHLHQGLDAGLNTKDCPLARDNQIWQSGKQISMQTCPTDNQLFCYFEHIGQVKISFGQPVLTVHLPDGQVVQRVTV
jgi:hypothetical protein